MKHIYMTWRDVENYTQEILRQIQSDAWRPEYILGITRGGLTPANLISQYLSIPMHALHVSLRDGSDPESNLWAAEDAFNGKSILIVDDINDTGNTLNWIKQDWPSGCHPRDERWNSVWGNNVRVACLFDNESSNSEVDVNYVGRTINKLNDPSWVVFPWEEWWLK
jgi:hypoxanthine phosphoribosyltransferase